MVVAPDTAKLIKYSSAPTLPVKYAVRITSALVVVVTVTLGPEVDKSVYVPLVVVCDVATVAALSASTTVTGALIQVVL
jgi:uncharacterized protein (DUF983 family)